MEFNEINSGEGRAFKAILQDYDEKDAPLMTELDETIDDLKFKEVQSAGSCSVKDIQNFIYGGMSSRFWMLRKHIITMSK